MFGVKPTPPPILGASLYGALAKVMDNLLFNGKCDALLSGKHLYSDGVIGFRCEQYLGGHEISIYDQTNVDMGRVLILYPHNNPVWNVDSELCRQKIVHRLEGIIEMASQLPSREGAFCKKL